MSYGRLTAKVNVMLVIAPLRAVLHPLTVVGGTSY